MWNYSNFYFICGNLGEMGMVEWWMVPRWFSHIALHAYEHFALFCFNLKYFSSGFLFPFYFRYTSYWHWQWLVFVWCFSSIPLRASEMKNCFQARISDSSSLPLFSYSFKPLHLTISVKRLSRKARLWLASRLTHSCSLLLSSFLVSYTKWPIK